MVNCWYILVKWSVDLIEGFFSFGIYRRPNLLKGFTSIMTQRKTFQIMKLLSITRERRSSIHLKGMYVSLAGLTKTSLLHIKSYSDGILDLDILGSNMYNG